MFNTAEELHGLVLRENFCLFASSRHSTLAPPVGDQDSLLHGFRTNDAGDHFGRF